MKYYKVLKADGSCCNGGTGKWYLPKKQKDGSWKPGRWMPEIEGKLIPCKNGYHICRPQDLIEWLDEAIFEVEYKGEIIEAGNKCVVRKARLLCKVETWNEKTARLFAIDIIQHLSTLQGEDDNDKYHIDLNNINTPRMISGHAIGFAGWYAAHKASSDMSFAAWCNARDDEIKWQAEKLMEYLEEVKHEV